jgi:flagellar basal-body rod protein FlgF
MQVLGTGGPITIPADAQSILIGSDGTVSIKSASSKLPSTAGQLKLVNPAPGSMVKGLDGMFRQKSGDPADVDPNVHVLNATLEGSNVNVVETMVGMIAAARQYEMQLKMLSTAEQNEQKASTVLST